jgi:hypothetical protein
MGEFRNLELTSWERVIVLLIAADKASKEVTITL